MSFCSGENALCACVKLPDESAEPRAMRSFVMGSALEFVGDWLAGVVVLWVP